jgi:predicted XRE-type DNA-binding protein
MKKRVIEGIEVSRGSGNVFADLDLPDAETLQIKTWLVIEIRKAIRQQGLTQQAAATRMGLTQPKVCSMMRGGLLQCVRAQTDGVPESARLRY